MPEGKATLLPWNSCPVEHAGGVLARPAMGCQQMGTAEWKQGGKGDGGAEGAIARRGRIGFGAGGQWPAIAWPEMGTMEAIEGRWERTKCSDYLRSRGGSSNSTHSIKPRSLTGPG